MDRSAALDVILLLCLLAAVLSAATPVPQRIGYLLATGTYAVVLAISFVRGRLAVRFDRVVLVPVIALWAVFLVEYWLHPDGTTLRTGTYIVFSALNLFVVPATFPREAFIDALAVVSAVVAGIALPLVWFDVMYNGGLLGVWHSSKYLDSVLTNPNKLSALSAFGFVAMFGVARSRRRKWVAVVGGGCCLVGLAVSQGRAAALGVVGAVVLLGVYRLFGTRAVVGVTVIGIAGAAVLFRLALGPIGGIEATRGVSEAFNNRGGLWSAAIRAILDRPALGYGLVDDGPILAAHGGPTPAGNVFSVHNSYLRMFLMTGVIGGVLYLLVCLAALVRSLEAMARSTALDTAHVFLPLLVVVLVIELFGNSPIFGLSFVSVYGALVFGYSQQGRRLPLRAERVTTLMSERTRDEETGW